MVTEPFLLRAGLVYKDDDGRRFSCGRTLLPSWKKWGEIGELLPRRAIHTSPLCKRLWKLMFPSRIAH